MLCILLNMIASLCNNRTNMSICQRIKNGFAFSAAFDQFILLENAQLMRDRRLRHIKHSRQITHTYFRRRKHKQYPYAVESPNTLNNSARSYNSVSSGIVCSTIRSKSSCTSTVSQHTGSLSKSFCIVSPILSVNIHVYFIVSKKRCQYSLLLTPLYHI